MQGGGYSAGSGCATHIELLVPHPKHGHLVPGLANHAGEHGARRILSTEPCLHHARACECKRWWSCQYHAGCSALRVCRQQLWVRRQQHASRVQVRSASRTWRPHRPDCSQTTHHYHKPRRRSPRLRPFSVSVASVALMFLPSAAGSHCPCCSPKVPIRFGANRSTFCFFKAGCSDAVWDLVEKQLARYKVKGNQKRGR